MSKRIEAGVGWCLCAFSFVIAHFAGFSLRNILIGGAALATLWLGADTLRSARAQSTFRRFHFLVEVDLERVLATPTLYNPKAVDAAREILKKSPSCDSFHFTWLGSDLFYFTRSHFFKTDPTQSNSIPTIGARLARYEWGPHDTLVLRMSESGYEVAFLPFDAEDFDRGDHAKGLSLAHVPYGFFGALQSGNDNWDAQKRAEQILRTAGWEDWKCAVTDLHTLYGFQKGACIIRWFDV